MLPQILPKARNFPRKHFAAAWRADTADEKELQALPAAVARLLGRDAAHTSPEDRLQTVAG